LLRDYLSRTDAACPNCRYNLRGLASDRCPECHQRLELRVALTSQRVGQLIATILPLAAVSGAAAIMLLVVAVISIDEGSWPSSGWEMWLLLAYPLVVVLVLGGALVLLSRERGRRWFRERSAAGAALVVWTAWAASAVVLGVWLVWLVIEVI
jgi:hypothetical protein